MSSTEVVIRADVELRDAEAVGEIVAATGFFSPAEVAIAVELVEARLAAGEASGYFFVLADEATGFGDAKGELLGYACYGPIDGTLGSFDLFWIAIRPDQQGRGLGRRLMQESERRIAAAGGRRIYAETSGRPQYEPTRAFYARLGYTCESRLVDFYGPGDDKIFFVKAV
jgi:ribosomal protein S18 acetylase RimI-like enzyme